MSDNLFVDLWLCFSQCFVLIPGLLDWKRLVKGDICSSVGCNCVSYVLEVS